TGFFTREIQGRPLPVFGILATAQPLVPDSRNQDIMKTPRPLLLSILLAVPCATVLAGNVYKWVDEHGVVHYTDQAPAVHEAERLSIKTSRGGASTESSMDSLDSAVKDLERQKEIQGLTQRQKEETAQEQQAKQERCQQARQNLETIKNNARLRTEENGAIRYLTPEEILERRDTFEKI